MTEFQYKRAPIIEAVVEFRSNTSVDGKKRQKAFGRLKRLYANYNPVTQQHLELEINADRDPKTTITESILHRFSSKDMTQQLFINDNDNSFLVSQLAPYSGWETFKERIMRDWNTWQNVVKFQNVNRVGMRYINRIDLPVTGSVVQYEDYVTVYPAVPDLLNPCSYHSVNVSLALEDIQCALNVKTALIESPLPDHISIVVDLDIVKKYETTIGNEELYSFISQARTKKNQVFEACITDKARELFNQ